MGNKKILLFLLAIPFLFFIGCNSVMAKDVVRECRYAYKDDDKDAFASLKIYDDDSAETYLTGFNGQKYDSSIETNDWPNKKDLYTSTGNCPKYLFIMRASTQGVTISFVSEDLSYFDEILNYWNKDYDSNSPLYEKQFIMENLKFVVDKAAAEFTFPDCDVLKEDNPTNFKQNYVDSIIDYVNAKFNKEYTLTEDEAKALRDNINSNFIFREYECENNVTGDNSLTPEEQTKLKDNIMRNYKKGYNAYVDPRNLLHDYDDYEGKDVSGCDGLLGSEFKKYLQDAFDLIQVIGPVLALILCMVDLLKATASGEDDAKKKALKSASGRIIASVLLYLVPAILTLILNLSPIVKGSTCNIS